MQVSADNRKYDRADMDVREVMQHLELLGVAGELAATPRMPSGPSGPWEDYPLHRAVAECSVESVRTALAKGANPNQLAAPFSSPREKSLTPLGVALAWTPRCLGTEIIRELLVVGASIDGGPQKGSEVSSDFGFYGTPEVLRLLLGAGMRIDKRPTTAGQILGIAASAGNIDLLVELLNLNVSANALDSDGCTAIYQATRNERSNRYAIFRLLLAAGADPNAPCRHEAALHRLLEFPSHDAEGDQEIVRLLLRDGADPNLMIGNGPTPLETVATSRHSELASGDLLISHGAKVSPRLAFMMSDERVKWVDFLADRGLDFNVHNEYGVTPLHAAIQMGRTQAASAMLRRGADPAVRTKDGRSILHMLSMYDREAVPAIELLLPYRLDFNAKSRDGLTPLLARTHAHSQPKTIASLLKFGADPVATDPNGRGIVHRIAANANVSRTAPETLEALRIAVAGGAQIDAMDRLGNTPLMSAVRWGQPALVEEVIALGADVNRSNRYGLTPLHFAAYVVDPRIIRVLLEAGARKDAVSTLGELPRDLVASGITGSRGISFVLQHPSSLQSQTNQVETRADSSGTAFTLREQSLELLSSNDTTAAPRDERYGARPDLRSLHVRFNVP